MQRPHSINLLQCLAKKHEPNLLYTYVLNAFLKGYRSCTAKQNIFEKTFTEVCNPYLYASFGTFLRPNWSLKNA